MLRAARGGFGGRQQVVQHARSGVVIVDRGHHETGGCPGHGPHEQPQLVVQQPQLRTGTDGFLVALEAAHGDRVEAGQLIARLDDPRLQADVAKYRHQLAALDALAGRSVQVHEAARSWCGLALGIAEDGALQVRDEANHIQLVHAGDVSVRAAPAEAGQA